MANEFGGLMPKKGENTDIIKTVDTTPVPDKPAPPKPPAGWDKLSYGIARAARK
jgi:hypothetical protein